MTIPRTTLASLAVLLAASGMASAQTAPTAPKPQATTQAAAPPAGGMVLDYRDKKFRTADPAVAAGDKAKLVAAVAPLKSEAVRALGRDFTVLGHAKGQLARQGDVDFYLLSLARPVAAEPFPKSAAQVIVALKGDEAVASYTLPADRQYARLVGAVDMDGDKTSEVLLEGSGYNMGQLIVALAAVKLATDGTTSVAQAIPEVYADSCDNPVGAKTRSAKTLVLQGGKLVETVHPEKCG